MVAPITGPFTRTETVRGPADGYGSRPIDLSWSRTWKRQRRPYNLPLDFTFQRGELVKRWHHPQGDKSFLSTGAPFGGWPAHDPSGLCPEVYNKAYAKFKSKLASETAGMAVNWAQRKQAIDMIAMRAAQLTSFARHLSKGRFGLAAGVLGLTDPPKGWRKKGKSFGSLFLEAHFGWEPLVKDIGAAVEILQSGVPPSRVVASSKGTRRGSYDSGAANDPRNQWSWDDAVAWQIGADVIVSNPNLWLANQLGFVNPALVAWDMVPFSFVLGWFVSVEEFLSGFTDFWGLAISNSWTSSYFIRNERQWQVQKNWPSFNANTVYYDYTRKFVQAKRVPGGIPTPSLLIRQPWRLSPIRGLTAVSLLLQQLRR